MSGASGAWLEALWITSGSAIITGLTCYVSRGPAACLGVRDLRLHPPAASLPQELRVSRPYHVTGTGYVQNFIQINLAAREHRLRFSSVPAAASGGFDAQRGSSGLVLNQLQRSPEDDSALTSRSVSSMSVVEAQEPSASWQSR